MTFEQWQRLVNKIVKAMCGMEINDMPDWDYWTAWDEGVSPEKAARCAIAGRDHWTVA